MKYCIVSFSDYAVVKKLNELGYFCYNVISSERVSSPISCHSDVLYQKTGCNTLTVSSCQKGNLPLLNQLGYKIELCDDLSQGYRTESLLNYIVNDKYIIYNPKTAHPQPGNKKEIKVKQGYTRCSTVCVCNNAYITEDEGIYRTLSEQGIDCLKIEKGNVRLDGYNYGFIGGACVKLNDDEILFIGDFENQSEKEKVISFMEKHNVKPIFMENKKLNDIGSALILNKI